MGQAAHCWKCARRHPRPVGRKCFRPELEAEKAKLRASSEPAREPRGATGGPVHEEFGEFESTNSTFADQDLNFPQLASGTTHTWAAMQPRCSIGAASAFVPVSSQLNTTNRLFPLYTVASTPIIPPRPSTSMATQGAGRYRAVGDLSLPPPMVATTTSSTAHGGARPKTNNNPPPRAPRADVGDITDAVTAAVTQALAPLTARVNELERDREGERRRTRSRRTRSRERRRSREGRRAHGKRKESNADRDVVRELRRLGLNRRAEASGGDSTDADTSTSTTESENTPAKRKTSKPRKEGKKRTYKSGRDMTAEDCEDARAPWPHHRVFKGENMRGAPYDSLDECEFIYGYMALMEDEKWRKDKNAMISYLKDFMEDAKDRSISWTTARNFHGMFLTLLERDSIKWSDSDEISKMKGRYMRNQGQQQQDKPPQAKPPIDAHIVPCMPYQQGNCTRQDNHNGVHHICVNCWRTKGRLHKPPERECYAIVGAPGRRRGPRL